MSTHTLLKLAVHTFTNSRRLPIRGRLLAVGAALALVTAAGATTPRPAEADSSVMFRTTMTSGSRNVTAFRNYVYTFKFKNEGTAERRGAAVIKGIATPFDFQSISIQGDHHGVFCSILASSGVFGARARCWGDLEPGQEVTIRLRVATGPIFLHGQGEIETESSVLSDGAYSPLHSMNYAISY